MSAAIFLLVQMMGHARDKAKNMQVKVLFDKDSWDSNFYTGWGLSFLIDDKIIFDTGEDGDWLINNMENLKVNFNRIEAIAISHDHWDHTGGLWEVLDRKKLKVYGCPDFSEGFKSRVKALGSEFVGVDKVAEIAGGIYLTGQISGLYAGTNIAEQATVIKTTKGISVLTGCSHPGIAKILEKVKSEFPKERFYLVAGGFHLIEQDARAIKIIVEELKKMQISKVGPTHCTGREAVEIFKTTYKNYFISIKVGQIIEI